MGRLDDPVRHTTQSIVAERVRIEILSGSLPPGSRLQQADLAKRMNTSTTPVREALRELASEGLVQLDPHRGVIVHQPSAEELAEIYWIRKILEPEAMTKTVEHITDDEIHAARELMDRMESEKDPGTWTMLNNQFHGILAQASRSPLLASILRNLRDRSSPYVASSMRHLDDRIRQANQEHAALLEACIDDDAATAIKITIAHLEATISHGAVHPD